FEGPDPDRDTHWCHEGGFTLLEVLIAITILALMAGIIFSVVLGSTRRSRALEGEMELRQTAGSVLNLIAEDLKGAYVYPGSVPFLLGRDTFNRDNPADGIDLVTTAVLPVNPMTVSSDLAEVGYTIIHEADNEIGTLFRREQTPPEEPEDDGGETFELTDRVLSLNIRYFDGEDWNDDWDSRDTDHENMTGKIPSEIEIEITLVDEGAPITLRTVISPPMAVKR
ncbi:prepilin-type N-terminal cleavage/methylation domain-containing protein, partial [bacterium]